MNRPTKPVFIIYSRSYCHLCEDMLNELMLLKPVYSFEIKIFDVDLDDLLLAQYDELVPVLMIQTGDADPDYVCHYRLDHAKVTAFLSR